MAWIIAGFAITLSITANYNLTAIKLNFLDQQAKKPQ